MKLITCKDINCPLRVKCAIAHRLIEGKSVIYKGYLDDPKIKETKRCEFYQPIKGDKK